MSKTIAVHGATGTQGGSVVKSLLTSDWKVIAITRNAVSDAADTLKAAGAEVMTANFDDEASLVQAYKVRNSPAIWTLESAMTATDAFE